MAKKRNSYLLEFLSIVFAVTLALVLDEWRQSVKDDALTDQVLSAIKSEVESNQALLKVAIPYHDSLINELTQGEHLVLAMAVNDIPVNIDNNRQLTGFVSDALLIQERYAPERLEIKRAGNSRFLVVDDNVLSVQVEEDTLRLYGATNIQLRSAQISNNGWQLSQATQVLVKLPFDLIDALSRLHSEQVSYRIIADQAIEIIYTGRQLPMGVLQDLYNAELGLSEAYELLLPMLEAAVD